MSVIDDAIDEGDETMTVTMSVTAGTATVADGTAILPNVGDARRRATGESSALGSAVQANAEQLAGGASSPGGKGERTPGLHTLPSGVVFAPAIGERHQRSSYDMTERNLQDADRFAICTAGPNETVDDHLIRTVRSGTPPKNPLATFTAPGREPATPPTVHWWAMQG